MIQKHLRITEDQNEKLKLILKDMNQKNPHIKSENSAFQELISIYEIK